jgi:cell fate regulator YaaT (PSP1 superfamily)
MEILMQVTTQNNASTTIEDADTLTEEIPFDDSLNIIIEEETNQSSDDENSNGYNDRDEKENSRFKDGETITMIRVRFPGNARSFPFLVGKRRFAYGQKVIAMSDRGMSVGYVNSFPYDVTFNKSMLPIRSIAKEASPEDIRIQMEFRESEKKAEVICINLIEKYKLDMILTHVEFTQFGKKAVFYFNAPARVDFRDLVKDLVYDLKMRIELRQISVRDRAAAIGAIGACGLQTCCSSFLKNYGNVSIKMAKNQNLALIPTKLNGVCGQIKCCIKYEDDVYTDKRKNLPREGSLIATRNGDCGKVLKLHILIEQFEMLTDTGIKRTYAVNQYHAKDSELGPDYRFPETFEHITNETSTVIGLTVEEKIKADQFMENNVYKTMEKNIEGAELTVAEHNEDFDEFVDEEENVVAPVVAMKQPQHNHPPRPQGQPGEPRPPGQGKNRNRNRNRNRNKNSPKPPQS